MEKSQKLSIFYIPIEKVNPNPFQPRKDFNLISLQQLANSIRQYGVLQPVVVTRKAREFNTEEIQAEYELISGERRLRASKLAGLVEIPAVVREDGVSDNFKLELAIIENLQREDLNPVDRALAFKQLTEEFSLKQVEIANKVGKSREYVSNTLRLLLLDEIIIEALKNKKISEGHTRPLLMLQDRKEEQQTLFQEIMFRNLTVREAELLARKIAVEKQRIKGDKIDSDLVELEQKASSIFNSEVLVQKKGIGGKLTINFNDKEAMLEILNNIKIEAEVVKEERGMPGDDDLYSLENFSI